MAGGAFIAGAIASKMLLDITSWNAGVSKVESDKTKMDKSAKTSSEKIRQIGTAATAAGVAIVGSFGKMVSSYVAAGDEIDKMSLRTGIAASSLSELRYAAQIAGTNIGTMEKGIKKMAKTIVDAETGLETYVRSFDRIGISVEEIARLKPEDQFTLIGEAIAGLSSETEKAATAQEIFGRAGTQLLPLFKQGADGISELREQARELGIVFDTEAAANAAKLQDAQTALRESMKGLGFALAETLIPALTSLAQTVTNTVVKIREWATANPWLFSTVTKIVAVLGTLLATLGPIVLIFPKIVSGIAGVGKAFVWLATNPAGIIIAALAAIAIGFMKVKEAQAAAEKSARLYEETAARFDEKLRGIAERAGLTADEFERLKQKYNGNTNAMVKAIRAGKEGVELQNSMIETGKKNVEIQEEQRKQYELQIPTLQDLAVETETVAEKQKTWLDYLQNQGIMTTKEKADRVDELERFIRELNDAYRDGKIDIEDWKKATESAREEIESLTESVGVTVQTVGRDMTDVLGAAIDQSKLKVHELPDAVAEAGKIVVGNKDSIWNKMTDGIKTQWVNMWSDMFAARSWDDIYGALKTFGQNVLNQITDIAANAFAKWTTGFIDKMISGTASMAENVVGSVGDVANAAKNLAAGFSPGGMIATAVGTAVGSFLGSLIGGGGAGKRDTQLIKDNTWETAQHARNVVGNTDAIKWSLWNMEPQIDAIKLTGWSIYETIVSVPNILKEIAVNTNATVKLLRKKKGAQTGAVVDEPDFMFVHGSRRAPEYIIPADQMPRMGGGGDVNVTVNLNNPIMTREYTRNEILPEIIDAVKSNVHRTKLKESLGIA